LHRNKADSATDGGLFAVRENIRQKGEDWQEEETVDERKEKMLGRRRRRKLRKVNS
jgi:hypothetical protein